MSVCLSMSDFFLLPNFFLIDLKGQIKYHGLNAEYYPKLHVEYKIEEIDGERFATIQVGVDSACVYQTAMISHLSYIVSSRSDAMQKLSI